MSEERTKLIPSAGYAADVAKRLFAGGAPTEAEVRKALNEALASAVGGNGRRRRWSPIAAKLFEGTTDTGERSARLGRCEDLKILDGMAADETLGRQYRQRAAARARVVRKRLSLHNAEVRDASPHRNNNSEG